MPSRLTPLLALPLLLAAAPVVAQETQPPVPIIVPVVPAPEPRVDDTPEELTWEEIPEYFRTRVEPLLDRVQPQAVLHVDAAITPDTDFRTVDHADILFAQTVRPAGIARITRPVRNANKYGPLNAVLWPGVGPDGEYWCWRRSEGAPTGNIYCYTDRDADGEFDRLMENDRWFGQSSRFQFKSLGHDERVPEKAAYEVSDGSLGDIEEVVALQYDGVSIGLVSDDGKVTAGRIRFRILVGPSRSQLAEMESFTIRIRDGRGELVNPNGMRVEIDSVDMDGTARVRVVSGMPAGRGLLRTPLTRELVIGMLDDVLNPDGSIKSEQAKPEGTDSDVDEDGQAGAAQGAED